MTMPADLPARTVEIPVRIRESGVELLYGGQLPPLKDGTVGTLIVPAFSFRDEGWLRYFEAELTDPILPAGSRLLAAIRPDISSDEIIRKPSGDRKDHSEILPEGEFDFVEIILEQPLELTVRGSKSAILRPCSCKIPSIKQRARSLNHAYALISEHFETQRISHTGNVFKKISYSRQEGNRVIWHPLDALRMDREAAVEQRLISFAESRAKSGVSPDVANE
jgi:hypothetical protein